MATTVRTRFAPSPTGRLHLGNARVALANWLLARKAGGKFLLRLDDTDRERSSAAFAQAIEQDLAWLGLDWDEQVRQSDRFDRYAAAANRLKREGRLYPCFETEEELALKRKAALSAGRPPLYDRAALKLSDDERAKLEADGRQPHWRFLLEAREMRFADGVHGEIHVDAASQSDPVLIRADGSYLYMLPSVVDDLELGVSDVLRGDDHISNTAVQIQMFEALREGDQQIPRFAHFPLLVGVGGEALSKRLGTLGLGHLREDGYEAIAIAALLARLGTSEAVAPAASMAELVDGFDLTHFSHASPHYDPAELDRLNAATLHEMAYEAAAARLDGLDAALWEAVRPNLSKISEAEAWKGIVAGPVDPVIEDRGFTDKAADLLPPEPWDETTWSTWIGSVKDETGAKGKALFMPLRKALTGLDHGPELGALLRLIGREKAAARLRGEAA